MGSPSTVLSLGFGGWGNVHLLPTLGFGIGTVTASPSVRFPTTLSFATTNASSLVFANSGATTLEFD